MTMIHPQIIYSIALTYIPPLFNFMYCYHFSSPAFQSKVPLELGSVALQSILEPVADLVGMGMSIAVFCFV